MRSLYTNFVWALTGESQSMLVENGQVLARGNPSDLAHSDHEQQIDLIHRFMLPGFIDAHCHILPTGLDLQKLHLGLATSHEEVLDLVRDRHSAMPEGEWLMAVHYDQTKFADGQHMSRDQLDQISTTRPILLRHVNGHASVVNSATLAMAKVDEKTPDPKGGKFVRDSSGRLTGVLLERAHEAVTDCAKTPTLEQMTDAILAAGERMAKTGITCASDMMTGRYDLDLELQAYRLAAQRGCKVRTRLYLQWSEVFGPRAIAPSRLQELIGQLDEDTCRVAGIKIFADGAIGSATAAIYGRFTGSPPDSQEHPTDGQLIYAPDRLKKMVKTAHEAGYSIAIHSIGDRSTDLVLEAYGELDDPSRHRIEHAMILNDAQITKMHELGIHCTMQPEFLMRFGHSYRRQLGPERASQLKLFRSILNAGIPLSLSSDQPIVGGDPWDGILTAEERPDGFDPAQNMSRVEALHGYTAMGAVANQDKNMGSLEPGHLADYQLYKEDPLTQWRPEPLETKLAP